MQPRSQRSRQCTACSILEATQETGGGKIDAAQAAERRLRIRLRTASRRGLQAQRERRAFATQWVIGCFVQKKSIEQTKSAQKVAKNSRKARVAITAAA